MLDARGLRSGVGLAFILAFGPALGAPHSVTLTVDASNVAQRVVHCKESVSVEPGPNRFVYPKWIPGTHSPDESIADVVSLRFIAGGNPLAWRRDSEDMYQFHVDVPAGV